MRIRISAVAIIALCLILPSAQGAVVQSVLTGLTVSGPSSLNSGKTAQLTATARFDDGSSESVTPRWTSSNTGSVTVSSSGLITAKNGGSAKITASYTVAGVTKTASLNVTVTKVLQSLTVSGATSLVSGKTARLTATANFSDGAKEKVTPKWTCSNTGSVTVSGSGLITAKKAGSAKITASYTYAGVTKTATLNVTVTKVLQSLTVTGTAYVIPKAKITLTATAKFNDGSSAKVTPKWTNSGVKIAAINASGQVTGLKVGAVTIKASYTYAGVTKTGSLKVSVVKRIPKSASLSGNASVFVGKKLALKSKVVFTNNSSASVKGSWTTSNSKVATVSSSGQVTGKKDGSVTITFKYTEAGKTVTASKKITVQKQLKSLSISGAASVAPGRRITLTATAVYTDGSKGKVTPKWKSSSAKVATVSASGVVTAVKAGNVTVTATYTFNKVTKNVTKKITVK